MASQIEFTQEFFYAHFVVLGDVFQDARQGLHPDRIVLRNHFMVFTVDLRCHSHMGTPLPRGLVAQTAKRLLQGRTGDVAGQLHATRSSSRTKWRRITLGRGMVSSK